SATDGILLAGDMSNVYHIQNVAGYESLTSPSMSVFYQQHVEDSIDLRLLGLASVKYIVTTDHAPQLANTRVALPATGASKYIVLENLRCKPRAYLAYKTKAANSAQQVTHDLLDSTFDGTTALLLKEDSS